MKNICILCDSSINQEFITQGIDYEYETGGYHGFRKCSSCGLVFLSPMPTTEQLVKHYPPFYHCYNEPKSKITRTLSVIDLKRKSKLFNKLIGKTGNVLDIGSSDGRHFDILKKFGQWKFIGIDINEEMIKNGRSKGRDLYLTTVENFKFKNSYFDLIIMDHLLEHVTDPNLTLKSVYKLLKTGGYIVGATPNITSLDAKVAGKYWGGNHFPRHTYLFSPTTLKKIFEKNDLFLKKVSYEYHTGHWALSIQNFFQSKSSLRLKLKNGRAAYYPILLLIFLPLNILQKWFHLTGVISFIAIKTHLNK